VGIIWQHQNDIDSTGVHGIKLLRKIMLSSTSALNQKDFSEKQ
jgi:hypothetical protein